MAGEVKGKRPYSAITSLIADTQKDIIDLTLDSDGEPPTKRAKSSTKSSTPVDDSTIHIDTDSDFPEKSSRSTVNGKPKVVQQTPYVNEQYSSFVLPKSKPIRFESRYDVKTSNSSAKSPIDSESPQSKVKSESTLGLVHLPKSEGPILASDIDLTSKNDLQAHSRLNGQSEPSKASIRVNIPLLSPQRQPRSPEEKQKARDCERQRGSKRREVLAHLKEGIHYAQDHPQEIEDLFGVTGFSKLYTSDPSVQPGVAQRKRKSITERARIVLDLEKLSLKTENDTDHTLVQRPQRQARDIILERLRKGQDAKVSFTNRRNHRQLDGKFQLVNKNILSARVAKKKQGNLLSRTCQCPGGLCGHECECYRHRVGGQERMDVQIPTYRRRNGVVVLTDDFLKKSEHESLVIRECGSSCSCSSDCINRLIQKGRTIPLQIFETVKCGFGVRAKQDVYRGQFLACYFGEVLTDAELSKREDAVDEDTPSYVMSMDYFTDTGPILHVDSSNFGSVARFFNHSCDPNCKTLNVILDGDSKLLYHIAFFAVKDIPKGKELTIDYDPHLTLMVGEEATMDLGEDIVRCQCGQPNCRKRLWPKGKDRRRRKRRLGSESD